MAALLLAVAAGGCTPRHADVASDAAAPAAQHPVPAPTNPDLGTVMERYYQFIEGAHWPFAYAMLSRRYRATLDQDHFVALYQRYADLDVHLLQRGDRVVVATIGARDRGSAAPARRFEETTALEWDGADWRIDRIVRRDLKPAGTR